MSSRIDEHRAVIDEVRREMGYGPRDNGRRDVEDELPPPAICALHAPPLAPIQWAADDFWTAGEYGLIVGEDGTMKTTLLVHILCAIAGGYQVFGRFATRQRPVMLVSQEDSIDVLLNRAEAMIRGHGWNRESVLGNLHIHALDGASLSSAVWRRHLRAEIERLDIGFVGCDPLAELATGDENDNSERRVIVQAARGLAKPVSDNHPGAGVALVHHANRASPEKRKRDRIRGATAIPAGSRVTYFVEEREGEIVIECLKLSRAPKLAPFVVRPIIESDPDNRASWTLARFDSLTVRDAALQAAERFILAELDGGVRATTTDLKNAAKGTGVSAVDLARGLKTLETRHLIDFQEGEHNAKLWGHVGLPSDFRQPGNQELDLARQAEGLPGKHEAGGFGLPMYIGNPPDRAQHGLGNPSPPKCSGESPCGVCKTCRYIDGLKRGEHIRDMGKAGGKP